MNKRHSHNGFIGDLVDRDRLVELLGDDQRAIDEFLTLAADELRNLLENLDSAILRNDADRVRALAHELKGASANIGALSITAPSRELEVAAAQADWPAAATCRDRLAIAFARLEAELFERNASTHQPPKVALAADTQRIVAIDDSAVSLKIYQRLDNRLPNCAVFAFNAARMALRWCQSERADLVIVDYMMPDLNGIDFLRRFRRLADYEQVPVLMVTSEREREIRHRALELGATDFLTKPVDLVELVSRTRNMLALRRQQLQLANTADFMSDQVLLAIDEIAARERDAILRLSRATEFRDIDTGAHIVRMSHYCKAIAQALQLRDTDVDEIFAAAPMHDIGKVAVPDSILLKPGKLTPDEYEIMKRHTTVGYDILKDSPARLLQTAASIALTHHEKHDGSGYPQGLRGDQIPIAGRICAVSDVFDALTSVRPYKEAWPVAKAVDEMHRLCGSHFAPAMIAAFDAALDRILAHREQSLSRF